MLYYIINYLASGYVDLDLNYHQKKSCYMKLNFIIGISQIYIEEGQTKLSKRCMPEDKMKPILLKVHASADGGYFDPNKTVAKVFQCRFF